MNPTTTRALDQLSPFQLKDELIRAAKTRTRSGAPGHAFLNAGRGNPNWVATTPREAFVRLSEFALLEAKRVWDEPNLAGMPAADGIAERFAAFLSGPSPTAGARLLRRAVEYATLALGCDPDEFVHELTDAAIGDNYPEPDRMLVHAERIVQRYLSRVLSGGDPPAGSFDLFAVEGGTAGVCYVFHSLFENRLLRAGDAIAIGTPIFTPYLELPRLADFDLRPIAVEQSAMADGRHTWQYPDEEIEKLADPRIKAFFIVNPSNPASFAMHPETRRRLVELVRERRTDLAIVTDDVYATFSEGFRSLAADLPRNTIVIYSFSKHFGCTGWRLGVVAVHRENLFDAQIAALPDADRAALRDRYASLTTDPDQLRFVDRMVADSRDVALNHTAGLSTPQQAQMMLFALFALLDGTDRYERRCRQIVKERLDRLAHGLGVTFPADPLRAGYYVELDLAAWGQQQFGDDFPRFIAEHHAPLDIVLVLARRFGTVLLNGSGFDGPPWSIRISLANLDAADYEAIGRDIRTLVTRAVDEWRAGPAR